MRTQHHIRKSTLLAFAAGRLSEALSTVAAAHLAWCGECRKLAEAAASARDAPPEAGPIALPVDKALGQTALQAMDRLAAAPAGPASEIGDFGLPMPLALRLDGRNLADLAWRKVLPGVAVCDLDLRCGAAGHLRLVRMAPGKALPRHGHGGCELSLVLRGAYRDEHGRYAIGDVSDLDSTAVHRPVAEDQGPCICLLAADGPARFRSWSGRLWQRLAGF